MLTITTLSAAVAAKRLQDDGLGALGLTTPFLSPRWTDGAVGDPDHGLAYTPTTMSLSPGDTLLAPFRGTLEIMTADRAVEFTGADEGAFTVECAALRLHPQAAARLRRLSEVRYGTPAVRPVAVTMVIRSPNTVLQLASFWVEAEEAIGTWLSTDAVVSFHDDRGKIVDPPAAAAMFADLLAGFPALLAPGTSSTTGSDGGLQQCAKLAPAAGTTVVLNDLHGAIFRAPRGPADPAVPANPGDPAQSVMMVKSAANVVRAVDPTGRVELASGESLLASPGDDEEQRLRWGWATTGTLARTGLTVPALPTTAVPAGSPVPALHRQFLRVAVVDVEWHLLGNRNTDVATVLGVHKPDAIMPTRGLPVVRDRVRIDYLTDGVDSLAAAGQVLARVDAAASLAGARTFICSPTLEAAMQLPPEPGPKGHWPLFPVTVPAGIGGGFGTPVPHPATGITAVWAAAAGQPGATDVVVSIALAAVPAFSHVRIYPQKFIEVAAIGPEQSFVRGDGTAIVLSTATPAGPPTARLIDPLNVKGVRPTKPATLLLDIVVTPRVGRRRLFAGIAVPISEPGGAGVPAVTDGFLAATDPLGTVQNGRSTCEVPLFGLARSPKINPSGGATSVKDLVLQFVSEGQPRQGPRLPTMARFETVVCTGVKAAAANDPLLWDAVLTGGRWARESRSAGHADGNPGNPAGPDVLASGVRVDGALAYDLALHGMRRAEPLLPTPLPIVNPTVGWLFTVGNQAMTEPKTPTQDAEAGKPARTTMGAVLETVAAVCETPELVAAGNDSDYVAGLTFQQLVSLITPSYQPSEAVKWPDPTPAPNAERAVTQAVREVFASKYGVRDALWSLHRVLLDARDLVYIEGPHLAATATAESAGGTPDPATGAVDLIDVLAKRLTTQKTLRVVIALPKYPDIDPVFGGWQRQAFDARTAAVARLRAVGGDRVQVFHPVGFPGRSISLRTTTVVVDDVWLLSGATHWRRRGMTMDGSVAVASFDRALLHGRSVKVQEHRRRLMAATLGVSIPGPADSPSVDWVRLGDRRRAHRAVADTLNQGGLGRIQPFYNGPKDGKLALADAVADPDGRAGSTVLTALGGLFSETPPP